MEFEEAIALLAFSISLTALAIDSMFRALLISLLIMGWVAKKGNLSDQSGDIPLPEEFLREAIKTKTKKAFVADNILCFDAGIDVAHSCLAAA